MKIVALDSDILALKTLTKAIKEAEPRAEVFTFRNTTDALAYIKTTVCDVVCMDISAGGADAIKTAGEIAYYRPKLNLIFIARDASYAMKAFQLHASGYLLKPVTSATLKGEFTNLRYQLNDSSGSLLRVSTFGNFEVFYHDVPVKLRPKSKELFAYLVDRSGALVTNNELYGVLFEDEPGHEENLKKVKKSLVDSFHNIGLDNVLVIQRGAMAVNTETFDCDLYAWRSGNPYLKDTFFGEYMTQYSWAEYSKSEFFSEGND